MTHTNSRRLNGGVLGGLLSLGLAVSIAPAAHADAVNANASITVSEAVDRTMSALEDATISAAEAESILELVDVDRVAQFSLGNHWKDLSDAQKTSYLSAFHTYANKQLQSHLSGFSDAAVEIGDVSTRGSSDSIVQTTVTNDGQRQTVNWRVIENGGWKVVDIEVQDVWFAIQQRAQFDAILDKNGGDLDALINEIGS